VFEADQNDLQALDNYNGSLYITCPTCHRHFAVPVKEIPAVTQLRIRKTAPAYSHTDWRD
jgi:hypothetical protein